MTDLPTTRFPVTVGSRGVGAAMPLALAQHGADVAITCGCSSERATAVKRVIKVVGWRSVTSGDDSAEPAAAAMRSANEAGMAFGRRYIFINNAATAAFGLRAVLVVASIDALLAEYMRAPVLAAQLAEVK